MNNLQNLAAYIVLRGIGGLIAAFLAYEIWQAVVPYSETISKICIAYVGFWLGWLSSCMFFNDISKFTEYKFGK